MGWDGMDGLPIPGNMHCCTHFPAVTLQRRVQPSAMSDHAHPSRQIGAPRGPSKGCWDSDLHSLGLHLWLLVGEGVCHSRRHRRQARASRFAGSSHQTPDWAPPPRPSDRSLRLSPATTTRPKKTARPDKMLLPMTVPYAAADASLCVKLRQHWASLLAGPRARGSQAQPGMNQLPDTLKPNQFIASWENVMRQSCSSEVTDGR